MESENRKLVSRIGVVIDLILTLGVFLLFTLVIIPPHVPFYDPTWNFVFSAYTSLVMAGFFWMACNLFRVTLSDQLQRRKLAANEK